MVSSPPKQNQLMDRNRSIGTPPVGTPIMSAALGRRIGDDTQPLVAPQQAATTVQSGDALEFSTDDDTMSSHGALLVLQRVLAIASMCESTPSNNPSLPQPGSAAGLSSGASDEFLLDELASIGLSDSQEEYRCPPPPADPIKAEMRHMLGNNTLARVLRNSHRETFEQVNTTLKDGVDEDPEAERQRVMARIAERDRGEYDFGAMEQAARRGEVLDHASYLKNTIVEPVGDQGLDLIDPDGVRGFGLIATRDIKRGDIVLVEKALCTVDGADGLAQRLRRLTDAVIEKIGTDRDLAIRFLCLHRTPSIAKSRPVIGMRLDHGRVMDIVRYNALDDLHFSYDHRVDELGRHVRFTPAKSGLWLRASGMNHSCLPNTSRATIGDMLVVRATRDIRAGDELMTNYVPIKPFQQRTESLQRWKFRCDCQLCVAERLIPEEFHLELEGLDVEAKALFDAVRNLPRDIFLRREPELREQWIRINADLARIGGEEEQDGDRYADGAQGLLPRPGFRATRVLLKLAAQHPRLKDSPWANYTADLGDSGEAALSMMREHGFLFSEDPATGTPIADGSNGIYDMAALESAKCATTALGKNDPGGAPGRAMDKLVWQLIDACYGSIGI